MGEPEWAVVVPVKRLARAKTRLRGVAIRVPHDELVLAMAQDTVEAALGCVGVVEVLVVTDDPAARNTLRGAGARVEPDTPGAGLNAAITYGAALAAAPRRWTVALTADLPALRPEEMAAALRAVARAGRRGFVPDGRGAGTTLLAAPPEVTLDPQFGPDSAAAHARSGAQRLDHDWPSLRLDVDTPADLAEAARLGLGRHTTAVFGALAW